MLIDAKELAPRARLLADECWRLRSAYASAGAGGVAPSCEETVGALLAAMLLSDLLLAECMFAERANAPGTPCPEPDSQPPHRGTDDMSRPVFDTGALWASLSPEKQRAIGIAAIDREIVVHGRLEIEGPDEDDFSEIDDQAEDLLIAAVEEAIDLSAIEENRYPLPSFLGVKLATASN